MAVVLVGGLGAVPVYFIVSGLVTGVLPAKGNDIPFERSPITFVIVTVLYAGMAIYMGWLCYGIWTKRYDR